MASKETDDYVAKRLFIWLLKCFRYVIMAAGTGLSIFQWSFRVFVFDKKYHKYSKLKQDKKEKEIRFEISSLLFCGELEKQFWVPVLYQIYEAKQKK